MVLVCGDVCIGNSARTKTHRRHILVRRLLADRQVEVDAELLVAVGAGLGLVRRVAVAAAGLIFTRARASV